MIGLNKANDCLDSQRISHPAVRNNWVFLVGLTVVFIFVALPYLLSPYVFIVHNPVDDALVTFLGMTYVRPVLYLCTIVGGLLGLILYGPIHQLYTDALRDRFVRVGVSRGLMVSAGPSLGILWSTGLQALWNNICPFPNTGNLLSLFFALPGITFGIVVSLINLIEYNRAKRLAFRRGFSLQFTLIKRQRNSYRLELIPLYGRSNRISTNHALDVF